MEVSRVNTTNRIKELVRNHNPSILFLVKTRANDNRGFCFDLSLGPRAGRLFPLWAIQGELLLCGRVSWIRLLLLPYLELLFIWSSLQILLKFGSCLSFIMAND